MQFKETRIKIFSLTFHKTVFLPLLLRKLKPIKDEEHSNLEIPFEYTILAVSSLFSMVVGLINYQAIIGLIIGLLGATVFFSLLISSIRSHLQTNQKPTWEGFRLSPFLFLILLGITIGLVLSAGAGVVIKIMGASCGLIIGYLLGIPAGLWIQSLGWIRTIIEVALVPVIIGLFGVSILMAIA